MTSTPPRWGSRPLLPVDPSAAMRTVSCAEPPASAGAVIFTVAAVTSRGGAVSSFGPGMVSRAAIRAVDVANMLGTTPETVSRWNQGHAYPRPNKENLLVNLEYIVERLAEFYTDPNTARAWLYSRHIYFNGLRPADLIREGRIEEVLEAIQSMANPEYT